MEIGKLELIEKVKKTILQFAFLMILFREEYLGFTFLGKASFFLAKYWECLGEWVALLSDEAVSPFISNFEFFGRKTKSFFSFV